MNEETTGVASGAGGTMATAGLMMGLPPLAIAGLVLGGLGTAGGLFGQHKARKEAKRRQQEADKRTALQNLMLAAGGDTPSAQSPIVDVPQVDYWQALSGLGNLAMGGANVGMQVEAANNKAEADAFTAKYQKDRQIEAERHNKAMEDLERDKIGAKANDPDEVVKYLDRLFPNSKPMASSDMTMLSILGKPIPKTERYPPEVQAWLDSMIKRQIPGYKGAPGAGSNVLVPGFTPWQ